jgi:hypothetical protein
LYNIANALFDQGRFAGALRIYRIVPRSASSHPLARKNMLACQRKLANISVNSDALRRPGAARLPAASRRLPLR